MTNLSSDLLLSTFNHYQYIDFSNNKFTGTLPFGYLLGRKLFEGLETMRVANNLLTGTLSSIIPDQIREVDLQGNDFFGEVPFDIEEFTNLQFVKLDNNKRLVGDIEALLKSVVHLKTFSARNTGMTGRLNGNDWESLTNLEILSLSDNAFQGTIPPEWGQLTALKKLSLASNGFTGLIPSTLGLLDDLNDLQLHNNTLVGSIPTELGMLGVEVLTLANNSLLGNVPTELGRLAGRLRVLTLSGNGRLRGTVPENLCSVPGANFSWPDIGCQLECSCCVNGAGFCSENEPSNTDTRNAFNRGTRNLRG